MGFIENNPAEKFILKPRRGAKGRGVLLSDASALVQTTDLLREMGRHSLYCLSLFRACY